MEAPVIAIVIPCYNEQEVLPLCLSAILEELNQLIEDKIVSNDSYLYVCDDGSSDNTWDIVKKWNAEGKPVFGLSLNSNCGHQNALYAALMSVRGHCDAAITIDADLQDDPKTIREMVLKYNDGAQAVFGVRSDRESDSWFKRESAKAYYSLQSKLGLEIIPDHADFRLLGSKALDYLSEYHEHNLYLRGIVAQLGLKNATVTYRRTNRKAGKSKYTFKKMLLLSADGITSFSSRPIKLIFIIGILLLLLDIAMSAYVFISYFGHDVIPGWTSIMLSVWFLGSIILISLGILGEYIGKIYTEVKDRPRYHIKDQIKTNI